MENRGRSSLTLRLPEELRAWVEAQAKTNFTSMNNEIIRSLMERRSAAGVQFGDQAPAAGAERAA